jgi:hypothetical protein
MHWYFWLFMLVALKVPVVGVCVLVWRVVKDTPDQVVGGEYGGSGGVEYTPGPRTRGPHDGFFARRKARRRGDAGHDEKPKPRVHEPTVLGE